MNEFDDLRALAATLGKERVPAVARALAPVHDGRSISFVQWGAPQQPEVVFLPGVGLDARSFDAVALVLDAPAIAIDLAGHGHSSWRQDADYSAERAAPDVVAVLEQATNAPVTLVGHSLGAMVAARVAALAPDRVRALILLDMTPDFPQRALGRIVDALGEEPVFPDALQYVEHARGRRRGEPEDMLLREARHAFRTAADGTLVRRHHFAHVSPDIAPSLGRFADRWPDLEAVRAPVTLVRADRGYVSPGLAAEFRRRLPHADVVTIAGTHALQLSAPRPLASVIAHSCR